MIFQEAHEYIERKAEELGEEHINVVDYLIMQVSEEDLNPDDMMRLAYRLARQAMVYSIAVGGTLQETMAVSLLRGLWIGYVAGTKMFEEE